MYRTIDPGQSGQFGKLATWNLRGALTSPLLEPAPRLSLVSWRRCDRPVRAPTVETRNKSHAGCPIAQHEGGTVRKNSTSNVRRRARPCLLLAGLMTACSANSDPDPAVVYRNLVAQSQLRTPTDDNPVFVTASVLPSPAALAPVPMAETSAREELLERDQVVVALGRNASQSFDPVVEQAFAATRPDLHASFVAVPDRDAVELMMVGRADFALLGGSLSAREQHAGLRQTRIGLELFALAVSPDFPARSLTHTQVRQVLSGEVVDWEV